MLSRPTAAPDPGSADAAATVELPTSIAGRRPSSSPGGRAGTTRAILATHSERALTAAAAVGDRAAFEEIVRRFGPDMLRFATNLLSDRGAAEDVVQDVLVDAWKGLRHFRSDSTLRTWLFSVVSHKVIDHRRRRSMAPAEDWVFEQPSRDPEDDPSTVATGADFLAALNSALAELPYRQRACWLLREVEGMKHGEIATIMNLSPSAVRGHITRARTTLGERLETWK